MTLDKLSRRYLIGGIDSMRDLRSTYKYAKEHKISLESAKLKRETLRDVIYADECPLCAWFLDSYSCTFCPWKIITQQTCYTARFTSIKQTTRIKQLTNWIKTYQEELACR